MRSRPAFGRQPSRGCQRRVLVFALMVAAASSPAPSSGQLTSLRFHTFGIEDGMPHDAVYTVYQDRSGLVWVGTQAGLLRFEGDDFVPILHDITDSTSLADDHVMSLYDDGEGGLWVGTLQGWLNRLDLMTGEVQRIQPPDTIDSSLPRGGRRSVYEILAQPSGELLLATDIGPLAFDPRLGTHRLLDSPVSPTGQQPHATAALHHGGELWIGFSTGSVRAIDFTTETTRVREVGRFDAEVSALRASNDQTIWVGTRGAGVFAVDPVSGEVRTRLHVEGDRTRRLLHDRVQDLWLDRAGALWVATSGGLSRFPDNGGNPEHFLENDADPWSLPDRLSITVFEDRHNVLWVGTFGGLGRIHPYHGAFTRVPARNAVQDGVAGGGVLAVENAGSGAVWIGTQGGGLDLLDLTDGTIRHWPADPGDPSALSNGEVKSIARHPDGTLWLATMGGGVNRFDPGSALFERVPIQGSEPGAEVNVVPSVMIDREGTVWAGTRDDGLHRYDPQLGAFTRYVGTEASLQLGSDYVWPVIEDRAGTLWVGAFEGGLTRIAPDRSTAVTYTREGSELPSDLILTLFEGPRGAIWIGTEGAGLIRFDPELERFQSFTTRDGLPNNNVQAVLVDAEGLIWVSTNRGLARIDSSGEFTRFSAAVGLHGTRFYANAAQVLPDGRLAFGGQGGLTLVDPAALRIAAPSSELVLTDFSVGGEPRQLPKSGSVPPLRLGPSENFFAFRFAAIDYADPGGVEYRYALRPLQDTLVDAGDARVANYTSVPAGDYEFTASARNSFGVWNEDALVVPLVVLPPFHERVWFRSLVLAAIASLLTAAYLFRMKQIRRVHEIRFEIAAGLHDRVKSGLYSIAGWTGELGSAARRLAEAADGRGEMKEAKQLLDQVAVIYQLAQDTHDFVADAEWVVKVENDSLAKIFDKLESTAKETLRGIEFSSDFTPPVPDKRVGPRLRQELLLFFREALTNVVKHSGAESVTIRATYQRPTLIVSIEDDGMGFDPNEIERGSGLSNMERHVHRAGGTLRIHPQLGRGTLVEAKIRVR